MAYKPDFADAYNNLGVVNRERDQVYEAIKNFEKAIDIKPDYFQAHSNLGNSLQQINQLDAAVKCYEKSLSINSELHPSICKHRTCSPGKRTNR